MFNIVAMPGISSMLSIFIFCLGAYNIFFSGNGSEVGSLVESTVGSIVGSIVEPLGTGVGSTLPQLEKVYITKLINKNFTFLIVVFSFL